MTDFTPFQWTPELTERARRLYVDEGMTAKQVGQIMGVSRHSIIGRVYRTTGKKTLSAEVRLETQRIAGIASGKARKALKKPQEPRIKLPVHIPPEPKSARGVTLLALGGGCKWPVGYNGEHLFCGCKREPEKPYCATHYRMSFVDRSHHKKSA